MNIRPTVGQVPSKGEVLNQDCDLVLMMQGWGMFGRRPAPELPHQKPL